MNSTCVFAYALWFGCSCALGQTLDLPPETIRVDLDVVLAPVSVTDSKGRPVLDLQSSHFLLWEDRVLQRLEYFSSESTPASVGVLFDVSHSMEGSLASAREAVARFLEAGHVEDEYFLLEFSDRVRLTEQFTSDIARVERRVLRPTPAGDTALYDAVYRGIAEVERGAHARKSLLIVTDGEDNHSRYTRSDIEEYLRESDVQVYGIGISAGPGRAALQDLAEMTGGYAAFTDSVDELASISRRIARTIQTQYVVGYVSTNPRRDGEWRQIRVRVDPRAHDGPLTVRARRGYFASRY